MKKALSLFRKSSKKKKDKEKVQQSTTSSGSKAESSANNQTASFTTNNAFFTSPHSQDNPAHHGTEEIDAGSCEVFFSTNEQNPAASRSNSELEDIPEEHEEEEELKEQTRRAHDNNNNSKRYEPKRRATSSSSSTNSEDAAATYARQNGDNNDYIKSDSQIYQQERSPSVGDHLLSSSETHVFQSNCTDGVAMSTPETRAVSSSKSESHVAQTRRSVHGEPRSPYSVPWTSDSIFDHCVEDSARQSGDDSEPDEDLNESILTLSDGIVKHKRVSSTDEVFNDDDPLSTPKILRNRTQALHISPGAESLSRASVASSTSMSSDRGSVSRLSSRPESVELQEEHEKWQRDLNKMNEFLTLKSSEQQLKAGCTKPVDSATIEDIDGMPTICFRFDVSGFKLDEVNICVEDSTLYLDAQTWEDLEMRRYRKTLLRRVQIPEHVDPRYTSGTYTSDGILEIMMPFHLGPSKRPTGPNVFPVMEDDQGRRRLRLVEYIGSEFTVDDVKVTHSGARLLVEAGYDAAVGKYGEYHNTREIRKQYVLPGGVRDIEDMDVVLLPDGRLFVDLILRKKPKTFSYQMSSKEVKPALN